MEDKNTKKRFRYGKQLLIVVLLVVIALITAYFALRTTTYEYAEIVKTHEDTSANNGNYTEYADGVPKYSRDGIAMLTDKGEELWNQPCQMNNPMAETCKNAAVVADQGGTSIYVFGRDGLKGEIKTTRPIEKVSVSSQGIVAAILQDEEAPKIMCYDAKGNLLIELKTSLSGTGYPVGLDLSHDGNGLVVSYLCTKGNSVATKVSFYYFGSNVTDEKEYEVAQKEYKDMIIPTISFVNKDTAVLISDKSVIIYEGLDKPKETQIIELKKEIQSIAYNEKQIVLMLKNSGKKGYDLQAYRLNGKQIMQVNVDGEYTDIKTTEKQIFLYDENKCAIYNTSGVCKFKGVLEMNILEIFPITGLNKYMVISANGFQEIQLAK